MLRMKENKNPDNFWREYEEKIGEKVLARGLGRYISGWEEFDSNGWNNIWGLIIICEGGFRFHHFPQKNWLESLMNRGDSGESKEKILILPKEKIIKAELHEESRWWKKIFVSKPPMLTIDYRDENGNEKKMFLETDFGLKELAEKLDSLT